VPQRRVAATRHAASVKLGPGTKRRAAGGLGIKRAIDVAGAAGALVVLSPLIAGVALLVRLRLGKPVIFTQQRPGRHAEPFTVYKFRTMVEAYDEDGKLLPDDRRLSPFGRFLRSTSLDELPELANVLRGDMSLVGPRPLLMAYVDRYSPAQAKRHELRPGMTGLAQVSGRNTLTWDERFALDIWYVEHHTTRLDLKIIGKTLVEVVRRSGIAFDGHATMPEFRGNSHDANSEGAPRREHQ